MPRSGSAPASSIARAHEFDGTAAWCPWRPRPTTCSSTSFNTPAGWSPRTNCSRRCGRASSSATRRSKSASAKSARRSRTTRTQPQYIETAHRRGYRFIAPISIKSDDAVGRSARSAERARDPHSRLATTKSARLTRTPAVRHADAGHGGRRGMGRSRDALRAQRRREHRVSGGRQRTARPRVRHGVGVASRLHLEGADLCPVSDAAVEVLPPDHLRQARHAVSPIG